MNQTDAEQKPDALQDSACVENALTLTLATEQLCLYLRDRRNRLQETRRTLQEMVVRLEKELAEYDQLLAELTT